MAAAMPLPLYLRLHGCGEFHIGDIDLTPEPGKPVVLTTAMVAAALRAAADEIEHPTEHAEEATADGTA